MNRLIKNSISILLLIFSGSLSFGQKLNGQYQGYAKRVKDFKMDDYAFAIREIEGGDYSEIDIKNLEGNVLRFKVDRSGNLSGYFSQISYIQYEFKNDWIAKITTYDKTGKVKGAPEFQDYAITEFVVKEAITLKTKFKLIDEQEGNIDMKDQEEKLVLKREFNSKNELIREYYIDSDDYWDMQHLQFRP